MKDAMENVEKSFKEIINNLFLILLLQGVSFVGTGVLIYFYPQIINALVIAGFVWLGLTTIVAGIRVKKFGKGVEEIVTKHAYSE